MISSAILGRYARSLAEVVFEQNLEAAVTEDLKTYSEIFKTVPDLQEAFESPSVPREVKENLLDSLIKVHPTNPITHNFLKVLLQHNRITSFQQIYEGYLDAVNEHNGVVSAKISTALPLDSSELRALGERLSGATGKQVNTEPLTDAELLGGMVVQIGDTIFDGSIKTKLAKMKRRLAEA